MTQPTYRAHTADALFMALYRRWRVAKALGCRPVIIQAFAEAMTATSPLVVALEVLKDDKHHLRAADAGWDPCPKHQATPRGTADISCGACYLTNTIKVSRPIVCGQAGCDARFATMAESAGHNHMV